MNSETHYMDARVEKGKGKSDKTLERWDEIQNRLAGDGSLGPEKTESKWGTSIQQWIENWAQKKITSSVVMWGHVRREPAKNADARIQWIEY